MPYTGKPSRGCYTCRARKVKCDEGKPTCQRCAKARRKCLGYRDESELTFRNHSGRPQRAVSPASIESLMTNSDDDNAEYEVLTANAAAAAARMMAHRPTMNNVAMSLSSGRGMRPHIEQVALNRLMFDFVLPVINPEVSNGSVVPFPTSKSSSMLTDKRGCGRNAAGGERYLHLLPMLQSECKPDSLLDNTVSAFALANFGRRYNTHEALEKAREHYSRAVALTRTALVDKDTAQDDQTLMAIITLGLYEIITSEFGFGAGWRTHVQGAAWVLLQRGIDQFKTPLGAELFRLVLIHVIYAAITSKTVPEKFFLDWVDQLNKERPGVRLVLHSISICHLQARVWKLLDNWDQSDEELKPQISELITEGYQLEQELLQWTEHLTEFWRYEVMPDVNSKAAHVYFDVSIAAMWNQFRVVRIFLHENLLHCWKFLGVGEEHPSVMMSMGIMSNMVDDICATCAYSMGEMQIDLTGLGAKSIGGFFMLFPLYVAGTVEHLTAEQKDFIGEKMFLLDRKLGIGQAKGLSSFPKYGVPTRIAPPAPIPPMMPPTTLEPEHYSYY